MFVLQRRKRDRGRVRLPSAPALPALEQFRPRSAENEDRRRPRPLDELVDEIEEPLVGPVEVLEDEHHRPLLRNRLEEAPPRGEALALDDRLVVRGEPDKAAQPRCHPFGFVLVGGHAPHRDGEL